MPRPVLHRSGAEHADVAQEQPVDRDGGNRATGEPEDDDAALGGERAQRVREAVPANGVDHDVDAAAAGEHAHAVEEAVDVDHLVGPALRATAAFSGMDTTAMTRAPSAAASWQAAMPTPPAAPCTSTVSPERRRARRRRAKCIVT